MRSRTAGVALSVAALFCILTLTPAAGAADGTTTRGMRGDRYCELLLLAPTEGTLVAQVWNTYGLNDCPADAWAAVDPATVASEVGVAVALRNGPRYWLIGSAHRDVGPEGPARLLDGIEMQPLATVALTPADITAGAYKEQRVVRNTTMAWSAGRRVYELTTPDGTVYVMQSWSQQVDPTLDKPALRALGDRLALPPDWDFGSRVLRRELRVPPAADGANGVLQDELMNAYTRRT